MKTYKKEFLIADEHIDLNNHMNNLVYMKLMLETSYEHSKKSGCMDVVKSQGKSWFIREHSIRYLKPVHKDDRIYIHTYFEQKSKLMARRYYDFFFQETDQKLAEAWTDWVLIDIKKQRPVPINDEILSCFGLKML